MAVRAPADRRFRRAQVKPTRRHRARELLRWRRLRPVLLGLVVLVGAYRAADLVLSASVFRVERIVVRGNDHLSTGEVLALVSGLRGQSLLRADLAAYRTRLLDSPWVTDATLRRVLPSTVEILVGERVPIALARIGTRLYLVDDRGVLVDEYGPQYAEFDLPIVDGLAVGTDGAGTVDRTRVALVARLVAALAAHPDLGRRVSQIDVRDAHDAVVILQGDAALLHLGEDQFVARLQSYVELAPALHQRVPDIDYVDLRFDDRVYVRPGGDSGAGAVPIARRD